MKEKLRQGSKGSEERLEKRAGGAKKGKIKRNRKTGHAHGKEEVLNQREANSAWAHEEEPMTAGEKVKL